MADIVTDISVNKNWNARKGANNPVTFTFTQSLAAFDISTYTFSIQLRKFGYDTNLLNLTQGSGITNNGAAGTLNVVITSANLSTFTADDYYWQMTVVHPDTFSYLWFQGTFNLFDQTYTGDLTTTVNEEIDVNGTTINVAISLPSGGGGGSMVYPGAGIPLSTGSAWGTSITDNSANWNTAFGWGNHAGLYWDLASGGTLTGANTITSNTANGLNFTGTWNATGSQQHHLNFAGAFTNTTTLGDLVYGYRFTPQLISNGTSQGQLAVDINPTFSGGTTPRNIPLRVNGGLTLLSSGVAQNYNGRLWVDVGTSNRVAVLGNIEFTTNGIPGWTGVGIGAVGTNRTLILSGNGNITDNDAVTYSGVSYATARAGVDLGIFNALLPTFSPSFTANSLSGFRFNSSWPTLTTPMALAIGYDYNHGAAGNSTHTLAWRNVNGNVLIGATTPTTNTRLDLRGTGTTTNLIQRWADSSNTLRLSIADNGSIVHSPANAVIGYQATGQHTLTTQAWYDLALTMVDSGSTSLTGFEARHTNIVSFLTGTGTYVLGRFSFGNTTAGTINGTNIALLVGTKETNNLTSAFNPNAGTGSWTGIKIDPIYNTTGTYSGTVYGIDYNPNINSLTGATHIAFRSTSGNWQMQGSGTTFTLGGGATASELRFLEPSGSGSNYIAFKATAMAGNTTYDLPDAYPAVSGYVLSSTTAGVLSWVAAGGGGGLSFQQAYAISSLRL